MWSFILVISHNPQFVRCVFWPLPHTSVYSSSCCQSVPPFFSIPFHASFLHFHSLIPTTVFMAFKKMPHSVHCASKPISWSYGYNSCFASPFCFLCLLPLCHFYSGCHLFWKGIFLVLCFAKHLACFWFCQTNNNNRYEICSSRILISGSNRGKLHYHFHCHVYTTIWQKILIDWLGKHQ